MTTQPRPNPVAYGVWIAGTGWLRSGDGKTFAALEKTVADSAAELWGAGARVLPVDDSLIELQDVFLAQQAAPQKKAWWAWLTTKP